MQLTVPFILASQSPRRERLLKQIGFDFDVVVSPAEEIIPAGEPPATIVQRLAIEKAEPVAGRHPDALVLAADTIVVLDDEVLGKPASAEHAREMLAALSGRTHTVYTGFALLHLPSHRRVTGFESTDVTFGTLQKPEIDAYVRSGSPMDKAGAYGIQADLGAVFVERIDGDFYNVVGLPLHRVYRVLREHFADILELQTPHAESVR